MIHYQWKPSSSKPLAKTNPLRLGPGSVPGETVRVHLGAVIASYMTIMRTSLGPNHKLFL